MYIADERFASTYERQAEGLASYFRDAIVANADSRRSEAPNPSRDGPVSDARGTGSCWRGR
jgi:hypothetical protein